MTELDYAKKIDTLSRYRDWHILVERQVDKIVNCVDMHCRYDYQRMLIDAVNSGY